MAIDTRTTMNLEADPDQRMVVTGIFLGDKAEFFTALNEADPEETLFNYDEELREIHEGSIVDATLALSGWNTTDPEDLDDLWLDERKYYSYKGFFLDDELSHDALDILLGYLDPSGGQFLNSKPSEVAIVSFLKLVWRTQLFLIARLPLPSTRNRLEIRWK